MTAKLATKRTGFNLVETLVACVILSGSVLALAAISTNALTDTTLNAHYEIAAAVTDEQLCMIDYLGIDQFLKLEQTEGTNDEFGLEFHWKVSTEYQSTDNLYLVTVAVTWIERNRPYSVTTQTMLDGTDLAATPLQTARP